jgi:ABC-type transport system involved in cytochrome c biogenesis permease subunit
MRQNLRHILFESDTAFGECVMAVFLFTFGMWIVSPFWNTFGSSKSYDLMELLVSDPNLSGIIWGSILTLTGALKFIAIAGKHYRLRSIARLLSFGLWLYVTISFALTNYQSSGTALFAVMALVNAFLIIFRGKR